MKKQFGILKPGKVVENIIGIKIDGHSKNNIRDEYLKLQREGKLPVGMSLQAYTEKKKREEEEKEKHPAWEIERVWSGKGW